MKKVYEYSHLGGSQILKVDYPEIDRQIDEVIAAIRNVPRSKVSREKTMRGRLLYSPQFLNDCFKQQFRQRGFCELIDRYPIRLPGSDQQVCVGFKQIDFERDGVLVEVQFGKYAFMFYDLAKFQYFFNESKANVGIEIVPCHWLHSHMSTGVSYGEQLINDIERLRRHFPAVPVKVILVDVEDEDKVSSADTPGRQGKT